MVKVFSDEYIFTVDFFINRKDYLFIVQKGDSAPPKCHTKHLLSTMMLRVVTSNGKKCPPIYIKKKEKMNLEVFISLLKKKNFPLYFAFSHL